MKRNVTIAAITAAVLIGGTTAATVAFADDGDRRGGTSTQQADTERDDRDDRDDDRSYADAEAPGRTAARRAPGSPSTRPSPPP